MALARAHDELRAFVDRLQIPVAHSLMGKGALPDDHPLVLGMTGFWGMRFTNEQARGADRMLALGARFTEADSSSWYPEYTFDIGPGATRLIHIDIEPQEIGRNYPTEIGAVADLKSALTVLNRMAREMLPDGRKAPGLVERIASERRAAPGDRFRTVPSRGACHPFR